MNTRSVSFVERLELNFKGNHFSHALTLGDVDGDGLNEFIIGNVDGTLAIFKGSGSSRPWCIATGLGSITCVLAGNLFNNNKDELICINALGVCYIFTVYDTKYSPSLRVTKNDETTIFPNYTERLPPNVKVMLVAGVALDGKEELFVGHTDRCVGVYRWSNDFKKLILQQQITLDNQIGSLSLAMTSDGRSQVLVSQVGGTYVPLEYIECTPVEVVSGEGEESMEKSESLHHDISMSLDEERERKREDKIGTSFDEKRRQSDSVVSTMKQKRFNFRQSSLGSPAIKRRGSSINKDSVSERGQLRVCPLVGVAQRNHPLSLTEVIGDIRKRPSLTDNDKHANIVALCTLDGCIRFMKDEKKVWEHHVDRNLFALTRLDVTNDGQDEIVVCAWNGTTYILDHSRNVVRYKFEDNVCAFCAGSFGFGSEHNKPCLIFSTFFNKIYIYYNITLPSISPSSIRHKIALDNDIDDPCIQLLQSLSDEDKRGLIHDTMYCPNNLQTTLNSFNS